MTKFAQSCIDAAKTARTENESIMLYSPDDYYKLFSYSHHIQRLFKSFSECPPSFFLSVVYEIARYAANIVHIAGGDYRRDWFGELKRQADWLREHFTWKGETK